MKTSIGGVYQVMKGLITYYYYGTIFSADDVARLFRVTERRARGILAELEREGLVQSIKVSGTPRKMYMVKRLDETILHIVKRISMTTKAIGLIE